MPEYDLLAGELGAGICALVGLGIMSSLQDVKKLVTPQRVLIPDTNNSAIYNKQFKSYKDIYRMNKGLYRRINSILF
jgi:xylulokinase